jgi:hypothetical protein
MLYQHRQGEGTSAAIVSLLGLFTALGVVLA